MAISDQLNKIENGGVNAQGKLSAAEYVELVEEVIEIDETAVRIGEVDGVGGVVIDEETGQHVDLSSYALKSWVENKGYLSSQSLKTINGQSIVGTGNINIAGGEGGGDANVIEAVKVNGTALTPDGNKAVDITAIPSSIITLDATHRFVSDAEKTAWNGKQEALVSGTNIKTINGTSILGSGNISITGGGTGGDANVIESISVNGTAQAVSNKNVDITVPTTLAALSDDTTHRLVTDTEKSTWNGKQAALVSGTNIKTINGESILGSGNISIQGAGGGEANVIEAITYNGSPVPVTDKTASIIVPTPEAVTETTVSGWGFTKNAGTVTSILLNNATRTPNNSGVVNLGIIPTDDTVVHNTNNETIEGEKTFSDGIKIGSSKYIKFDDSDYITTRVDPDWNDSTDPDMQLVLEGQSGVAVTNTLYTELGIVIKDQRGIEAEKTSNKSTTKVWNTIGGITDISGYVETTRTVNGKALSSNITLTASDVGALPSTTAIPSKTSDLTNDSGFIRSGESESISGTKTFVTHGATFTSGATLTISNSSRILLDNQTDFSLILLDDLSSLQDALDAKQDGLVSGTSIKTINNTSLLGSGDISITVPTNVSAFTNDAGYLTAHQNIKTVNNQSLVGTGNVTISTPPSVTTSDNGKVMKVVNGAWSAASTATIYSGSSAPSSSTGSNGDIYIQTS